MSEKEPKFTDTLRYPHGYTPSGSTDIRRLFERVRAQQEAVKREAEKIVRPIQQKRK